MQIEAYPDRGYLRRHAVPLLGVVLGVVLGASILHGQQGDTEASLPIQRIILTPDRFARELQKVQQGALVLWPMAQFESRLERAQKQLQKSAERPRLARSIYRAELMDQTLANGSGQWTVQNAQTGPALLPITPFNLALHEARWEQGEEATIGEFDGKGLALMVKGQGGQTCHFDWSARGTMTKDGLTFRIEIPPCPINILELTLPLDHWLIVTDPAVILEEPQDLPAPDRRLWKLQVTGQSTIELSVRKTADPQDAPATMFAWVQSSQTVAPDRIALEHEFHLDILHRAVRELHLECDGALEPYQVVLRSGEIRNWHWESAAKKDAKGKLVTGSSGLLTIQFRHPVQGKLRGLVVRSLAPQPNGKKWISPDMRIRNAFLQGELLQLQLHPDLPLSKWDPGTFRQTGIETETDGTQVVTLAQPGMTQKLSKRPSLQLGTGNANLQAVENYQWHITARGATLHAEIQYALRSGNLFDLSIQLPKSAPAYQIEALELDPPESLRGWHQEGETVSVELRQPLRPGRKVGLKLRLRARFAERTSSMRTLEYPELTPKDAERREGEVAIVVDPILEALLLRSSLPPATLDPAARAPSRAAPSFRFKFRDQKLSATVRITALAMQVQMQGKHTVMLGEQSANLQFRWEVQPVLGEPEHLDFRFADDFPPTRNIKTLSGEFRVHHWERLYLQETLPHLLSLGAANAHGLGAAALQPMIPSGQSWRLHLGAPLQSHARFLLEAATPIGLLRDERLRLSLRMPGPQVWDLTTSTLAAEYLPRQVQSRSWSIPLMVPGHGPAGQQEVEVSSRLEPIERIAQAGSPAQRSLAARSTRTTNYAQSLEVPGHAHSLLHLDVLTKPAQVPQTNAPGLEFCDEASLASLVRQDGRVLHRIKFRLWNWRGSTCGIHVPKGLFIAAVRLNGQALDRFSVKEDPDRQGRTRLEMQCDQNTQFSRYEILAESSLASILGGLVGLQRLKMPAIEWPVAPLSVQARCRLATGLVPLSDQGIAPVGVPGHQAQRSGSFLLARQLWTTGQAWWPYGDHAQLAGSLDAQTQGIRLAEAHLREERRDTTRLAETLERFAMKHLGSGAPLVVDEIAFRSLGLNQGSIVPATALQPQASRPFWESLGLVYVPCPSGALLTSSSRVRLLRLHDHADLRDVDSAVREAILHGRDASVSFASILTWLRMSAGQDRDTERPGTLLEQFDEDSGDSEWELIAGDGVPHTIWLADAWSARAAGGALAAVLLGALVGFGRLLGDSARFRFHLVLVTGSLLALLWLPGHGGEFFVLPSFLVALACFALHYVQMWLRPEMKSAGTRTTVSLQAARPVAVAMLAIGIVCGAAGQGPAPERSYQVFISDGAKPVALLTPDLISRLEELESRSSLSKFTSALVRARYSGEATDQTVRFDATLDLESFKDQAEFFLPLTGAQLHENLRLDGAPVFPAVHKNGYSIPVGTRGSHRLQLSFTARIGSHGDISELRLALPRAPRNKISIQWKNPIQSLLSLQGWGQEERTVAADQTVTKWGMQLGHAGNLHLRWRGAAKGRPVPLNEVREAHFWDLHPSAPALMSSFQFSLDKTSVTELGLSLPKGLQIRDVAALQLPPGAGPATPIMIKGWRIEEKLGARRLTVDFTLPVSGNIVLELDIVPQLPIQARQVDLPLPTPLHANTVAGLLGYRLNGQEQHSKAPRLSVQGISGIDFEQAWKKQSNRPIPAPSRAYSFQRKTPPGKAEQASLELLLQPEGRKATCELEWRVDLQHADLHARFNVAGIADDLTLLEFAIDPAVSVSAVAGQDVQRWLMQDSMLQVWLRTPKKQTDLEIRGRRVLPAAMKQTARTLQVLPAVLPVNVTTTSAILQLRPEPGVHLDVDRKDGLRRAPNEEHRYLLDSVSNPLLLSVRAEPPRPTACLLTKVRAQGNELDVHHVLRLATQHGILPTVTLQVLDSLDGPIQIDAPGAVVRRLKDARPKQAAFEIKYLEGTLKDARLPQEVSITIRARTTIPRQTPIVLPRIASDHLQITARVVAWTGVELFEVNSGKKASHDPRTRDKLTSLHQESELRTLAGWSATESVSPMRAVLPAISSESKLRVLDALEETRLDSRARWVHFLSLAYYAPESAELRVRFPGRVSQLLVLADQRRIPATRVSETEFVLPVGPNVQPASLHLSWNFEPGEETLAHPFPAGVFFPDVEVPIHTRLLHLPAGLKVANRSADASSSSIGRMLDGAAIHAQGSALLMASEGMQVPQLSKRVLGHQQEFHAALALVEYALATQKNILSSTEEAEWTQSLKALREKNIALARQGGYERLRLAAENAKRTMPARAERTSETAGQIRWPLPRVAQGKGPEVISAPAISPGRLRPEWILLAAVTLLLLSWFHRGIAIMQSWTPVAIVLIVAVLSWLDGMSLAGLILISLMALIRLGILMQKLQRRGSGVVPPEAPQVQGISTGESAPAR